MKRIRLDTNVTGVTEQRIAALNHILTDDEPVEIAEYAISLNGPEYGWLDLRLDVPGKKPFEISLSDVYPPFPEMKDWLEHLIRFHTYQSASFSIDCEGFYVFVSYDFFGHYEDDKSNEPVALIQLADDILDKYRNQDYEHTLQLIVPIRKFVTDLYFGIKNYMIENRRVFSKQWSHPGGGDFDFRKLMRSFESKKVEKELEQMNKFSESMGTWPLVRIR
jgi:hypothetical protein